MSDPIPFDVDFPEDVEPTQQDLINASAECYTVATENGWKFHLREVTVKDLASIESFPNKPVMRKGCAILALVLTWADGRPRYECFDEQGRLIQAKLNEAVSDLELWPVAIVEQLCKTEAFKHLREGAEEAKGN